MAKRYVAAFAGRKDIAFYDISGAVGYGNCPNQKGDVALIQYLLRGYFRKQSKKPLGYLVVDGGYGPMTHYWSLFFQISLMSGYDDFSFVEKGNFIPTSSGLFDSAVSLSYDKMLVQLNNEFRKANPASPANLEDDAEFPAALRGSFGVWAASAKRLVA